MVCNHPILEEKIIDCILGNLPSREEFEVTSHIEQCKHCKQNMEHWHHMIDSNKVVTHSLSSDLRDKIWENIEATKNVYETQGKQKRMYSLVSIAIIFCVFIGLLYNYQHQEEQKFVDSVHHANMNIQDFDKLNIVSTSIDNEIEGNMWVNHSTHEMLLEIQGLKKLNDKDYQLWIIYNNHEIQDEILPIYNGTTRLFIQGKNLNHLKQIKASVEPKGGSITQTGPETFTVEIKY